MTSLAKDDPGATNGKKEANEPKELLGNELDRIDIESELSDVDSDIVPPSELEGSDTGTISGAEKGRPGSSRQKALRLKVQGQAHAKQRAIERAKNASAKQAQAEHRRLDEEDNKLERRMESMEREFRKWSGVVRLKPLGKDRFHNRYWWFDGVGSSSLIASGGTVVYGTGRLFMQGPTEADHHAMERKQEEDPSFDLAERRHDQEGAEGMLAIDAWGYYTEPEQVNFTDTVEQHLMIAHLFSFLQVVDLMTWLNAKGNRELKLKENLIKWADHILGGMRKRSSVSVLVPEFEHPMDMSRQDLAINAKLPEARRSTRGKNPPENTRHYEPYMLWQNKKAPSAPS